jgi:death-on-curing protein
MRWSTATSDWPSTIAFSGLNGYRLTLTNDEAYTLVIEVSSGVLDDVPDIADRIRAGITLRRP